MAQEEKFELAEISELSAAPVTKDLVQSEDFANRYSQLTGLLDYLKGLKEAVDLSVKEIVKDNYFENNEASITTGSSRFTYVAPTTRESFDSKKFKEEHPDLYQEYVRVSEVKDQIKVTKIKPKKEKEEDKDDVQDATVVIDF